MFRGVADTQIQSILARFGPTRIYPNGARHGPTRRSDATVGHDTVRFLIYRRNTTRIGTKFCSGNETRIDTNRCDMGVTRIDTIRMNFPWATRHESTRIMRTRNDTKPAAG